MNPNNSLILVVDDETKIRRLISTNLAFEGFDVVQAEDGKRALEVLFPSRFTFKNFWKEFGLCFVEAKE